MAKVIHTCTGCVPIDASIVEVYTRLIATEARANAAAEHAEAATGKAPYIGENGNWWEWDNDLKQFVDTGVSAGGGGGSDPNAVKYTEQNLTDSQKAQARKNVGACSAEGASQIAPDPELLPAVLYAAQELTDAQKAQARENIGAGTSSFSGSYNDLQDKPQQITLSQDIVADKASTTKAPSVKEVYDYVYPAEIYAQPVGGMLPNVFYDLGVISGNITFVLAPPADANILNHYFFVFRTSDVVPNVTWPSSIIGWINGGDPDLEPLTHYEISIINGYAAYLYI